MLKKVLAISAALLIGGGLFAQTSADGGAKPAKAGSVNAVYDFSKGKPAGTKIGEDMFKYNKPTEVAPKAKVKGGKFILESGEAKWKTEKYTALYHNNSAQQHSTIFRKSQRPFILLQLMMPQTLSLLSQETVQKSHLAALHCVL